MRLFPAAVAASIVAVACAARVDAQSVDPGRRVFASRCAACHGTEGGGGELGPSIVARIPLRADADLEAVIREGLPGAGMPSFANLSKTESADLIAFLRTLRPRAGTGAQRTSVTLADGVSLSGLVLNQSTGEMQLLGDDRRVHLLRETTSGRYREVTSQTGWTTYNGQASGNRYSTLTQITPGNVSPAHAAVGLHAAQRVAGAGDARRRGRGDVRQRGQRSLRARRRQRASGLELSPSTHARADRRGGSRRESRRRGQRRAGLHGDRPRASHRAESCQRRAAVGDGDGRLAPELQRHGRANGRRRSGDLGHRRRR